MNHLQGKYLAIQLLGADRFRLSLDVIETQPVFEQETLKMFNNINADTIVADAMANIDSEYEALVAEMALVTV